MTAGLGLARNACGPESNSHCPLFIDCSRKNLDNVQLADISHSENFTAFSVN